MEEICTENNILVSFKCVCSYLETVGLPVISYNRGKEGDALVFTINSLWALIKERKAHVSKLNKNNELLVRQNAEITRLNQIIKSTEATVASQSADISVLRNKLSLVETEKQGLTSQINLLKKEINKISIASETDRKVYLKNIKDQKELVRKLNENIFSSNRFCSLPDNLKTPSKQNSNAQEITNECIQTLDCTIQNLLGEIAVIRCSYMKLFLDLRELVYEIQLQLYPTESPVKTDLPELVFQLPHQKFLSMIQINNNKLTEYLKEKLLYACQSARSK